MLAPTRELAAQIGESMREDAQHLRSTLKIAIAVRRRLDQPADDARCAAAPTSSSPRPAACSISSSRTRSRSRDVQTLVLDEADRLLDLGFADELERILALLPPRRQTLLFSATFPRGGAGAGRRRCCTTRRASTCRTSRATAPPRRRATRRHRAARDRRRRPARTQLLLKLIRDHGWKRVLVFVATQHAAEHVASKLTRGGLKAEAFHGDLSQGRRTKCSPTSRPRALQVLVATDVAARGIDIAQLPVVVNYDLPRSAADYVHRIGRTGRAGETGWPSASCSAGHEAHFRLIEKRQDLRVPREVIAGFEPREVAGRGRRRAPTRRRREGQAARARRTRCVRPRPRRPRTARRAPPSETADPGGVWHRLRGTAKMPDVSGLP